MCPALEQDGLWKDRSLLIWALKVLLNGNFYSWDGQTVRVLPVLSLKCFFDMYWHLYNVASLNWCHWKLTVDSDWLAKAVRHIQNQTAWVPVSWQWAPTFSTGKVIRAVMGKITILFRVLILCYFWKLLKLLILSLMRLSV